MNRAANVYLWACVTAIPATLHSQPNDTALIRRADSVTVGDYCRFAQRIVSDTTILRALGGDSSIVRANATMICNPQMSSVSLLALAGGGRATLSVVARISHTVDRQRQRDIADAMVTFRSRTRREGVRPVVASALGDSSFEFTRVSDTAHGLEVADSRDNSLRRLANYERKLGPASPKLNAPEVLLNYLAQRFAPGFSPTPLGGPSPWEVVASYTPGYITFAEGESGVLPVSASEFGLRFYLFGDTFGKTGIAGLLFPSYFSFGVLTASDENGALVWPWRGRDRSGGFVSWGTIKLGYIDRERGTWLFSKQFQAVPFVF